MIVLALDTALDACSVALVDGETVRALLSEPMNRGQAERLAPMAREAMQAAGARFADIDRIAVTTGPGSFTGVRVGLSFARALALALNRPCLGLSTLEALALGKGEAGLRGAVIETPGASYAALYQDGAALIAPQAIERGAYEPLFAVAECQENVTISGPGVTPDILALARRVSKLDPARYPPAPLYLRAALLTAPGVPL